jgi:uncharacterized protein YciI
MEFDRYTIVLLIQNPHAPQLDEEAAAALQDAHMNHLADLHEAGRLLAAGPLFDEELRGLSILNVEPEEAQHLEERDPVVQAGLYTTKTIPWMLPAGAMRFSQTRFPRSTAEAGLA